MRTSQPTSAPDLSHPKLAAAERWAARHLGGVAHERRVAAAAAALFDLTAPLHAMLSAPDRRLLQLAALVHDVGRAGGAEGHEVRGAAMVLSDASLPLAAAERRAAAYLTLYHRGDVPDAGEDDVLHHGEDDADRLLKLLALLRAADALDGRSVESPGLAFALFPGTRADARPLLRITCSLRTDCQKTRRKYERRKKFRLLQDVLECRVEAEVLVAETVRRAA